MANLGLRSTGSIPASFEADGRTSQQANNLVVTHGYEASENGHAYLLGIRAGSESGTTCSTRLVSYQDAGSGITTATLIGQTALIPITTDWDTSAPLYEEELLTSFLVWNNTRYFPGFHETNGLLEVGRGFNTYPAYGQPYTTLVSDTSPAVFDFDGYMDIDGGRMYAWIVYEPNVAPDIPSDFSPADGATVTDSTPLYEADFTDANQVLPGAVTSLEKMLAYQIQVRSVSAENATSGTVVWDSGAVGSTGAEQSAARFSKDHGGSALTLGNRYQWRARVQDVFGTWSAWSHADAVAWSDFLVADAGIVTLDGTPTGRVTDTTPDFQGRYHNVLGTAADRVQIQLYANGLLILTSPEITKAVSSSALPGTLFTITAAESAFGTLASGVAYQYRIRARTALPAWSDYSALRSFNTNAKPTTPTNIQVANQSSGAVVTDYPLVTLQTTDADGDALTVSLRIKDSGGTVLFTRSMTFDATLFGGTGGYKYQTTSTDLATYATYKLDASATDGDLTSAQSAETSFVYAQGPVVTVTSPTADQVITTDTPTFTWTVTDQQKERIRVYRQDDGSLVYDSTQLVDTGNSFPMPPNILANETDYYVTVQIEDSNPLTGTSAARNFRLEYVAPATVVGFVALPDLAMFDASASVVRTQWVPVETDASEFEGYIIKSRNAGQPYSVATVRVEFTNQAQSVWIDTTPVSGVELIYSIEQRVRESSIDVLSSVPAESATTVTLIGSVLSDVRDGLQLRAVFDSVQERTENVAWTHTEVETWDIGAPWTIEGPGYSRPIQMSALLKEPGAATADDVLAALRGEPYEAYPLVAPYGGLSGVRADGSTVLTCYRDERGLKRFGRVRDVQVEYRKLGRAVVSFEFQPVNYAEVSS